MFIQMINHKQNIKRVATAENIKNQLEEIGIKVTIQKVSTSRYKEILENKNYNLEVKNLLLSMLYKVENGYKDYTTVKIDADSKENFMKLILKTIEEQCKEIDIATPQTQNAKPLAEENAICKAGYYGKYFDLVICNASLYQVSERHAVIRANGVCAEAASTSSTSTRAQIIMDAIIMAPSTDRMTV